MSKSSADLLAIARAMAEHSAERYRELAEAFAMSCNPDTAEAFRQLAGHEDQHAAGFPANATSAATVCDHAPEIADPGAVHYLMTPWHAFDLALTRQERALALFEAHGSGDLVERQKAYITEIRARRDACPEPVPGWWEDADEPNWDA